MSMKTEDDKAFFSQVPKLHNPLRKVGCHNLMSSFTMVHQHRCFHSFCIIRPPCQDCAWAIFWHSVSFAAPVRVRQLTPLSSSWYSQMDFTSIYFYVKRAEILISSNNLTPSSMWIWTHKIARLSKVQPVWERGRVSLNPTHDISCPAFCHTIQVNFTRQNLVWLQLYWYIYWSLMI